MTAEAEQSIRIGHSPDPDDAFMFYGLAHRLLETPGLRFEHVLRDIQTLNDWALQSKLEITAISAHAYPYVQEHYALLASGASMGAVDLAHGDEAAKTDGRAQGPLLVSRERCEVGDLAGRRIAVPGTMTSAFLALRLAVGEFEYTVVPFDEIPQAVADSSADAGLLIHEGQLTFERLGLCCILDLGRWWFERTGLPLPLGCNVIRRNLGGEMMTRLGDILRQSIEYSLTHRSEALQYALKYGRDLDAQLADRFVGMYVNDFTLDYGPMGRDALAEFFKQAHQAGLTPEVAELEFVGSA